MSRVNDQELELTERINTIEEAYEFMLAYAAQGCQGNEEAGEGDNIRTFLERLHAALEGLGAVTVSVFQGLGTISVDAYRKFLEVVDQDAQKAQAAIQIVLSLPSISSQLIDNLNSSLHLRTLLTDLFLLDEALKTNRNLIKP